SPDSQTLASAGGVWEEEMRENRTPDPHVRLWDLQTGKERCALGGHERGARAVAFTPDGKLLATGDQRINRIWDPATGKEIRRLTAHKDQGVEALAFSRTGDVLISGGTDGVLRKWDVATGKQIGQATEDRQNWMRAVAISADDKFLVSAGAEAR